MEIKNLLLFAALLLLFDIPFTTYIMAPKYKSINLALHPNIKFMLCAYIIMILSWFLIQGDIKKSALTGFVIYGVYVFTLLSIYPGYKFSFAMTELIWGTFLFTIVTFILKYFKV